MKYTVDYLKLSIRTFCFCFTLFYFMNLLFSYLNVFELSINKIVLDVIGFTILYSTLQFFRSNKVEKKN